MPRQERWAASPRETSSRSATVSSRLDLVRGRGRTPPVNSKQRRIVSRPRSRRLAIVASDSPLARRSQISTFSSSLTTVPPIPHPLPPPYPDQPHGAAAPPPSPPPPAPPPPPP